MQCGIERRDRFSIYCILQISAKKRAMYPTPELVKDYIAAGLDCTHIEVEGDGQHFTAVIVSSAFAGKRPIQRHQLVYAALGDRMREEIHALSMKTLTPEEFQQ
ncbi:MAG: Cell division protein BolA [Herbaspirillum sp.]|jgi:acid stress-induced BolA-like protein IbaG/YrbA|nr:Cell division protein BolA [Herbaspirillum sp.]